jgi:TolB-like protein/Tfp pilus assembly protein PilF
VANFSLFQELQRRNVLRAGVLYAGAVWALAQGIAQLGPSFGAPDWITRWFVIAGVIGFPFWLAFAWFYEFTPQGLKRESEIDPGDSIAHHTGRKLNIWIFGVMALAIVLLLTNTFVLHRGVNEVAADPVAPVIVAPPNSIAVLPFTNESSDKQQDYFANGIAEDLLNLLTRVQTLRVAARTSSFAFQGKGLGIAEIAAKLHVANVLEGSVRKAGNEVRVSAQLVRASDGYQIWSQSYDRKLDDIFAIQDGIAADVVKQLKVKLLGAAPTARATDPRAYALYLQARQLGRQFTAEALKSSDALYRQALAIDPRYVQAWVGLARNFSNETGMGVLSNAQGLRQSHEATEKALSIDPDDAPAQAQLGWLAIVQNDLPAAARYLERALALDPTDLGVLGNSATLLQTLGRLPPAIAIDEYVLARDPVNPITLQNLGINYLYAGRYDEAIAKFHTVLSLSPGYGSAHFLLGEALLLKGDAPGGLAQMQQETNEGWQRIGLPLAYCALGRKADADAAFAALIAKDAKDSPYNIAYDYATCGEADQAFAWLDKAVAYQDPGLSGIVTEPLFDKIRHDPRWLPFLRKLGYAPEQLAKIQFTVTLPDATDAGSANPSATLPTLATSPTAATPARSATATAPVGSMP